VANKVNIGGGGVEDGLRELAKKKAMLDLLQTQLATRQALRNATQEDISSLVDAEMAQMQMG